MRKILQISVTVLSIFGIFAASSCTKIAGNSIDYYRLPADLTFIDGKTEFYGRNGQTLIDIGEKTFSYPKSDEENYNLYENIAVYGGTAPRYAIEIAEGYENIRPHLENLHIPNNGDSVIYTHGYFLNGKIYGICNTYKKTIGYLSGGGNYGVEEIAFSVYYEYAKPTARFSSRFRAITWFIGKIRNFTFPTARQILLSATISPTTAEFDINRATPCILTIITLYSR